MTDRKEGATITHQRHFACAVICRRTREGLQALVFESVTTNPRTGRAGKIKLKFPGGMQKGLETAFETMTREVQEETGLKVTGARRVYERESPENRKIIQFGFLVEIDDCTGVLHTRGMRDGNTTLSKPTWVDVRVILRGVSSTTTIGCSSPP